MTKIYFLLDSFSNLFSISQSCMRTCTSVITDVSHFSLISYGSIKFTFPFAEFVSLSLPFILFRWYHQLCLCNIYTICIALEGNIYRGQGGPDIGDRPRLLKGLLQFEPCWHRLSMQANRIIHDHEYAVKSQTRCGFLLTGREPRLSC